MYIENVGAQIQRIKFGDFSSHICVKSWEVKT